MKEAAGKENRVIGFAVKAVEQTRQAKGSKCIRASKQRAVLMVSGQKSNHRHDTDDQALQADFTEKIFCQNRLTRSAWLFIHNLAAMGLHA